MPNYLSYADSFKVIEKAKSINIAMLETTVSSFTELVSYLNEKFIKPLSSINYSLPTKKKKRLFARSRGSSPFDKMEPIFTDIWNKITSQYLNKPSDIQKICKIIKEDIIKPLEEIRKSYAESMNTIEKLITDAKKKYVSEEAHYKKAHSKYYSFCQSIQDCHDKINSGKADNKTRDNFTSLKNEFGNVQSNIIQENTNFNDSYSQYIIIMEECLTEFERVDKERDFRMNQIFENIVTKIEKISSVKTSEAETIGQIVKEIDVGEANALLADNNQIDTQEPVFVDFVPIPLSIKLTDYLQPEVIFQKELKEFYAIASTNSNPTGPDDISISKGDLVKVIDSSSKSNKWKVFDEKRNRIGMVDIECLERHPELEPKLARTNCSMTGAIQCEQNDIILIERIEGEYGYCIDMFNRRGYVLIADVTFL
ncbi:hypothetical protein GPJ56_001654 [Histomonas meleagridis]|uniref:uncharacterized protein n=1 Tax=Histomonas meleagridis TaxID=135588 RepID=UPI003559469D|nr:hypothetical protein GPJ56_001654 [Histomonas meleagridis]KAH0796260.1 hypothetical protein GO595_010153 [Histomonas meleagridis]